MELNNTIAKPLYKQLEDQLKEEIDIGKRKAGSRLPVQPTMSAGSLSEKHLQVYQN